ncbi:MAG: chemotaxis protein CheW, partial [Oscillospiraceae bacterium]|nr:chemotaxis protein CheW [Oscillospiraceae bacterium]
MNEINNDIILGGEGDKKAQKYLFFALDEIEYGVDISIVDEIITMTPVSPIPSTKPFCKGVINIRGSIVPIIDMRIKLGKPEIEYDDAAC